MATTSEIVPRVRRGASVTLRRKRLTGIALTAPAMIAIAITVLYPLLWTISLSFQKFDLAVGAPAASFVGFDNYARVLTSPGFVAALTQTVGYVVTTLIVELIVAMPIALLLNRATRGSRVLRLIIAIPIMIAPIVASLAFKFLFSNGYGFINAALSAVGIDPPSWFASVWLARGTVLVTNMWLALPFVILVLLAGLSNVPAELNEAAKTDGANAWQRFTRVTLPLLKPAILIVLVIRLADAFRVFDSVYVLTGGGPANSTDVMSSYLYRLMFSNTDFAGSSAATVLFVLVVGVCAGAIFFILRDRTDKP
ncbi:sugar ABC transporter permease [Diaminobutyricibacter tongyongensis]|uniref:Sugar ABC transporter permease n=1 Tax=Leifsonia tongyongensis TaxID=1268043 RepID=A0A6L9XTN3_9MICO|nr:sugar ABC transporter permease [Diaminobutyricibacter tongyongensis]NEN04759.1 sugar ABC transporter permease [Diaminobutyricibacter tongyongensis]